MDFKHDAELELKAQLEKINKLEAENGRLKEVIVDNELQDEVPDIDCISVEENICIEGINHIADKVKLNEFSKDEITSFNTLYNILRSIRGKAPAGNKKPKGEIGDLLKIVGKK